MHSDKYVIWDDGSWLRFPDFERNQGEYDENYIVVSMNSPEMENMVKARVANQELAHQVIIEIIDDWIPF